jgi:hypothetical protein
VVHAIINFTSDNLEHHNFSKPFQQNNVNNRRKTTEEVRKVKTIAFDKVVKACTVPPMLLLKTRVTCMSKSKLEEKKRQINHSMFPSLILYFSLLCFWLASNSMDTNKERVRARGKANDSLEM